MPRDAVHEHEADGRVDRLAVDVVVRRARRVVLRGAAQRDQRAGDQSERGQQQQRVQAQAPFARHERGRRLGGGLDRGGAHRDWLTAGVAALLDANHLLRIRRAAGPRSRRRSRPSRGHDDHDRLLGASARSTAYQDWSVVEAALGGAGLAVDRIGKALKMSAEVPPGSVAAAVQAVA